MGVSGEKLHVSEGGRAGRATLIQRLVDLAHQRPDAVGWSWPDCDEPAWTYGEVAGRVGVHARFGNGETLLHPSESQQTGLKRLLIPPLAFFAEMDKSDDTFFVCSDTEDFLAASNRKYGERVLTLERSFPAPGAGPGHKWKLITVCMYLH